MNLNNINKPTHPFWGKVQMSCASIATFISGYGHFDNNHYIFIIGVSIGALGTIIPIFISDGKEDVKPQN